MVKALTPQQKKVLNLIIRSVERSNRVPSYRELAKKTGCSHQHIVKVVEALVRKDEMIFNSCGVELNPGKYKVELCQKKS